MPARHRLPLVLAAVVAVQAASYVARPLTSYRLLALGAGPREVGLVAATFALVPMLVAIPLGRIADARRSAPLVVAGAGVLAAASALLGAASTVAGLAGATAVFGLGHLAVMLGVQNLIARGSSDEEHDRRFGFFSATVAAGQMLGPLLLGPLLGSGGTLAATTRGFEVAAGFALLGMALAAAAGWREPAAGGAAARPARGTVRALVRAQGMPAGLLASIAVLSAGDVVTAYLPVLGERRGIGPGAIGVVLAARAGGAILARLGISSAVRRLGRARLIAASAVAAAIAVVALTATSDPVVLGLLTALAGYGLGFGQPLTMTLVVQRVSVSARATALGLRLTGNRAGQVAVPALAGLLAGGAGTTSVFWLLGGLLTASAVAVRRSLPDGRSPDAHGADGDASSGKVRA